MTDLEKELTRQIHELSKELMALRERVAVLESRVKTPNFVEGRRDPYAPQPDTNGTRSWFTVDEINKWADKYNKEHNIKEKE